MIIEKIVQFIFGLPFFDDLTLSPEMMSSYNSIVQTVQQINTIINLGLLVDTFFFALGLYMIVGWIRVVIDLL